MSERRFIIAEMGDWGQPVGEVANYVVTESELLHRLYLIRTLIETGQSLCQLNERGIDILLHGEKDQSSYHHFLKAVEDGKQPASPVSRRRRRNDERNKV